MVISCHQIFFIFRLSTSAVRTIWISSVFFYFYLEKKEEKQRIFNYTVEIADKWTIYT